MRTPIQLQDLVERFSNADLSLPVRRGYAVPEFGPIISEPQETIQIRNPRVATGPSVSSGSFFTLYVIASGGGAGDTYLQCGSVTGGNGGSVTIADEKVLDVSTGPTETAGTVLYLKANVTATVTDGIMLPGCELNSAILTTTLADNHTFTAASDTGDLYKEVGRWTADNFYPSAPGNFLASGCIGNFDLSRT